MIIAYALLLLMSLVMWGIGLFAIFLARSIHTGYPRCGECKYNLTGFQGNRCPECGCFFSEVNILPPYKKWNRPLVLLGAFFILLGFLIFGLLVAGVVYLFSG